MENEGKGGVERGRRETVREKSPLSRKSIGPGSSPLGVKSHVLLSSFTDRDVRVTWSYQGPHTVAFTLPSRRSGLCRPEIVTTLTLGSIPVTVSSEV